MADNDLTPTSSNQGQVKAAILIFEPDAFKNKTISSLSASNDYGAVTKIPCQFNPTDFTITKGVAWASPNELQATASGSSTDQKKPQPKLNAPEMIYGGGKSATFKLENLMFDTTSGTNEDVRTNTNPLLALTLKRSGKEAPPFVMFVWGEYVSFLAVVTNVTVTYTHFLASGRPVRARVTVEFTQASDTDGGNLPAQNPTSMTKARKTRIIRQGERLDCIAYQEYGHVGRWRDIAEANGLDDPLALRPGEILVIPQKD